MNFWDQKLPETGRKRLEMRSDWIWEVSTFVKQIAEQMSVFTLSKLIKSKIRCSKLLSLGYPKHLLFRALRFQFLPSYKRLFKPSNAIRRMKFNNNWKFQNQIMSLIIINFSRLGQHFEIQLMTLLSLSDICQNQILFQMLLVNHYVNLIIFCQTKLLKFIF